MNLFSFLSQDLIGHCFSTLRELTLGGQRWPLLDPYKQGGYAPKQYCP